MQINFKVCDDKTPFKVMIMDKVFKNRPGFWVNPDVGMNPKAKVPAAGFVLSNRNFAFTFICKLMIHTVSVWTDLIPEFSSVAWKLHYRGEPNFADIPNYTVGDIVRVKDGWQEAGARVKVIGLPVYKSQWWVPVEWLDESSDKLMAGYAEDEPYFCKAACLEKTT